MLTLKGLNDVELSVDDKFDVVGDLRVFIEYEYTEESIFLKLPQVIELYEHLSKVINNSK